MTLGRSLSRKPLKTANLFTEYGGGEGRHATVGLHNASSPAIGMRALETEGKKARGPVRVFLTSRVNRRRTPNVSQLSPTLCQPCLPIGTFVRTILFRADARGL